METIEHLKKLIHSRYHIPSKGGRYMLKEATQPGAPVTAIPANDAILICKFDENTKELFPFFDSKLKGALEMADYIGFIESGGCCYVFIIELSRKSRKVRQRHASEDFAKFLARVAARTLGKPLKFCYRYIVVVDKNAPQPKAYTKTGSAFDESGKMIWKMGNELKLHTYAVPDPSDAVCCTD